MYRLIDFRPVDAHQWHKNGDHPNDGSVELQSSDGPFLSEGAVVRRFAHPHMSGEHYCAKCGNKVKIHGWIDQGDEGLTVCPGDWVVPMGPKYLVLSDHNFQALFYSTISGDTPPEPMQAVSYSSDKPKKTPLVSVRQEMDNSAAFELDDIIEEFDVSYTEIASNVLACALSHKGAKFSVTGLASCLDPDLYDESAAKEHAYNDAAGKVHQFEQYRKNMNEHLREDLDYVAHSEPVSIYFDIGTARQLILGGKKVANKDWNDSDAFVFYVPPGKYPASRNGKGTLLGLYPGDMVPYDGYLAVKMGPGNVAPWHPTSYDVLSAGWYLVE